jgi:hypothetical protein
MLQNHPGTVDAFKNEFVVCCVYVTLKQIIQMWSIFQKVPCHTTLFSISNMVGKRHAYQIQLWSLGQKKSHFKNINCTTMIS